MLLTIIFWLLSFSWNIVSALIVYLLLTVCLTIAWRTYKIYLPLWYLQRNQQATGSKQHWMANPDSSISGFVQAIKPNQCVLITGATSGIGLALARYLFSRGYTVFAAYYDSNEAGYKELKQLSTDGVKKNGKHNQLELIEMDVRDEASVARSYDKIASLLENYTNQYGKKYRLYSVINNAGLGSLQPFAWLQKGKIKALVETNLLGTLLVSREFMPLLADRQQDDNDESPRSRLLVTSSGLGLVPGATYATYGVTKASQIYLMRSLNQELKHTYGIDCVAVIPHNFVKNTNICSLNVKTNQLAWDELKPIERRIYEKEFKKHNQNVKALEDATREHNRLASSASQISDVDKKQKNNQSFIIKIWTTLKDVIDCLTGENSALTLEQTGALEQFERALRLESPPEHMFAGDIIYDLIVGSILLSIPISCIGLLGRSVAPSLYR